jgi:serine/threonine protein phosphatase PrpC
MVVEDCFSWVGSEENFVDTPSIIQFSHVAVGRYGGNSAAGQNKNEDACLLLIDQKQDWEFVILLDAHSSAESAELIVNAFELRKNEIRDRLSLTPNEAFKHLEMMVLTLFQSEEFRAECSSVKGETACLIVARKGKYCWWFSVGDCILYLHHPELAAFSQHQLNQRQFYEWIGQVNTFEMPVPCFSTGRKELRQGVNQLLLTTDGLIECPGEPFANPQDIFQAFSKSTNGAGVEFLLKEIQSHNVRDSTTIVSWMVDIPDQGTLASNQ